MEKLKVTYKPVDDIIPYENNPRYNDSAVELVLVVGEERRR